jgi:hypothetical protein
MEKDWYSILYNSLLIVGIIIALFTSWFNSPSSVTGSIIGYTFIITGTLLMTGFMMSNMKNSSVIANIITVGPFLVLIGILIYMVYLLSYYYSQITQGHISDSYYNFMNMFIVLLVVEFYWFFNGIKEKNFKLTGEMNKVTGMTIYLMELFSIIIVATLGIILKYFSTDG